MMGDASQVTIREGDVDYTQCNTTGKPVTVVTGYLDVGEYSAGWYTVGVTHDAPDRLPLIRLYIGDWTEGAGPDERWGFRMGVTNDGPFLADWSDAEKSEARPVFTPVDKAQVEGTPMEPQIWQIVDKIMSEDSRL